MVKYCIGKVSCCKVLLGLGEVRLRFVKVRRDMVRQCDVE